MEDNKDFVLFVFAVLVVTYFLYFCASIVQDAQATADDKKWAMALITSIIGGLVGFIVGRNTK